MSMLNIGGENAGDAFYRYKMPRLQCKVRKMGVCLWNWFMEFGVCGIRGVMLVHEKKRVVFAD